MFKENGRLKPADESELADKKGKLFECKGCNYREVRINVEFGDSSHCPKCEGPLIEVMPTF